MGTASWFEEMNSTWSPVWSTWMEQWDSQFLLWEETYGDEPWWPMWSAWMKEWKANVMTNNWWTMSANWSEWLSVPSATWWPSTTWSATNAALLYAMQLDQQLITNCFGWKSDLYQMPFKNLSVDHDTDDQFVNTC